MLQTINDKAKGWVAYTIVGFIAVPFALFGISSYLDGGHGDLVAATVNGEEIPVQQVQGVVSQQRQRIAQLFGGRLPANMDENVIKNQALEQVVNEVLLRQESEKYGYRASNQEIYDTISTMPAFQINGQFDPQSYESLLAQQHRSKVDFENQIRQSLSNQQFTQSVATSAFLPNNLVSQYQGLQNQTRNIETFTIKKSNYASDVSVSDDEVKKEFDANAKNYMTAERLKLNYVLLKQDDIAAALEPNDEDLQLFYEENQSRYVDPEKRKLAHIVVNIEDDKKDEAKAKATALYDQIKSGEKTFEELATSSSDDEEAAKNNGELGLVEQGESGLLFDTTAFSPAMLKGALSEVVETEAGFEIIKILDIIEAKTKPFEDVKEEIIKLYSSEEAEKTFLNNSDELQTLAFENDSSLDEAADTVGVKLLESDWIERNSQAAANEADPLSYPNVREAAFSDEVLNGGKNSELIQIDEKTALVVRLLEHELPKQKELSTVTDDIKKTLTDNKLKALLVEKGDAALAVLRDKSEWSALEGLDATAENVQKNEALKRTDNDLEAALVTKVFSMQKPESGKTFDKHILADGDYVLISLSEVKDGATEVDEALQQSYIQSTALRERTAILAGLREKAEVQLFTENIQ